MALLEILKDKKVSDFTKEELIGLANEFGVPYKKTNKDVTIFSNLVNFVETSKEVEIKILLPVSGLYLLSYSVGDVVMHDANQAAEMVENKDAEFVTKK
tara:strand:- start:1542 stop:1838 length:297 start_codon:yes stop_codon:yes gene_type:complete